MKRNAIFRILIGLIVVLLLTGCGPLEQRLLDGTAIASGQQVGTPWSLESLDLAAIFGSESSGGDQEISAADMNRVATLVQAELDSAVTDTPVPTETEMPTPELPDPEETKMLSEDEIKLISLAETLAAIGTGTAASPTETPNPTNDSLTNPPEPTVPCLAFRFVSDVTYPPYSIVSPSTTFFKSWYVQNVGTCTWNGNFALVFYDGFQLNGTTPLRLGSGVAVPPGDYVTLTIQLWTPPQSGVFTSLWMLANEKGTTFGGGDLQNEPLEVRVQVPGQGPPEFTAPASTAPPFSTPTP